MVTAVGQGLPPVQLELRADVFALIDVSPTEQPMFNMTAGDATPMDLVVSASDGKPFDILAVHGDPNFDTSIRPDPPSKKKPKNGAVASGSSRYVVTLTPHQDSPVGQRIAAIALTTDRPKAETVNIRPFLVVAGRVQVTPQQLVVRPGPEPPVLHVRLRKTAGDGLKITDVTSSDPDFTTAITSI